MKNNFAKNLLTQGAFWQVNKTLVQAFKIEAAVLLTEMVEMYFYLEKNNQLVKRDGLMWFYFTSEQIEEKTTLTYRQQKTCIDKLISVVETRLFGVPAKLHYRIDFEALQELIENFDCETVKSSIDKSAKQELTKAQNSDAQKRKTINKEYNKEINKDNKEREHTPEVEKDIIIYPLKENKQDVEETPPNPPLTYETLKAELWRKAETGTKLATYLRNLEIPLLDEKSQIVFAKIFDKWLAYQLSEKSKLNICDGTEESAIKLLHNQYKGKASIFMALNNWTCSAYSKQEAQKYMAELNKPAGTRKTALEELEECDFENLPAY